MLFQDLNQFLNQYQKGGSNSIEKKKKSELKIIQMVKLFLILEKTVMEKLMNDWYRILKVKSNRVQQLIVKKNRKKKNKKKNKLE